MNKSWSIIEKKRYLIELLDREEFDRFPEDKVNQLIQCLRLYPQYSGCENSVKEQIASWIIQNYSLMRNNLQAYFSMPEFELLSENSKFFLINLIKNYSKKINQQKTNDQFQNNQMFMQKNPYANYSPYNFMYPNQPFTMPQSSLLYPPNHYYPPNNQQFEKMYRQNLQYYVQMQQQMQMNYPPYIPGYNISPDQYSSMLKHGFSGPSMLQQPQSQPQSQPIQNLPPQTLKQPVSEQHSNNTGYKIQISKKNNNQGYQNQKDSNCSTKSMEDYQESFKRYYEMYGQKLGKQAPFIIIPPSKQKKQKSKQAESLQNKKKNYPILSKSNTLKNESSDECIIQDPKSKRNQNQNISYLPQNKKKLADPDLQLQECLCKGQIEDQDVFACSDCQKKYHYDCLKKKKQQGQGIKILCPFCLMKIIDPLNYVTVDIKHRYIENISSKKITESLNFREFDAYFQNQSRVYEIEVRCMRLEDAVNEIPEFTWPDESLVNVNDDKAIQFPALQLHSSVKKRKDSSIFLTYKIFYDNKNSQRRDNSKISLEIKPISEIEQNQKKIRNQYVFIIGFYLTKRKTVQELYQQIKLSKTNRVRFASTYFKEPEQQQEVAIQQIKVNLNDPFTWNLIETPSRGIKCIHGQCFDLKTYISFMSVQKNRIWKCPVCSKECREFVIDSQQQEAINQYKKHQKLNSSKQLAPEVAFHRDGRTLFCVEKQQEQQNQLENCKPRKEVSKQNESHEIK